MIWTIPDGGEGRGVGPAGNGQGEEDKGHHNPEATEVVDGGLPAGAVPVRGGRRRSMDKATRGTLIQKTHRQSRKRSMQGAPHRPDDTSELCGCAQETEGRGPAAGGEEVADEGDGDGDYGSTADGLQDCGRLRGARGRWRWRRGRSRRRRGAWQTT